MLPEFNRAGVRQCVNCAGVNVAVAWMWFPVMRNGRIVGHACGMSCQILMEQRAPKTANKTPQEHSSASPEAKQ